MTTHYPAFVGVAALLTVTPGADMAMVTRSALGGGWPAALRTSLGVVTGLLVWALAAAAGLAAVVSASAAAFSAIKLVGAAYLVVLGALALLRAGRGSPREPAVAEDAGGRGTAAYRQGLLTNLLNPKIAVFYTSFIPQFIAPGGSVFAGFLLLAATHAALGLLWLAFYGRLVTRAGDLLRRSRIRAIIEAVTGAVLVALGIGLATADR